MNGFETLSHSLYSLPNDEAELVNAQRRVFIDVPTYPFKGKQTPYKNFPAKWLHPARRKSFFGKQPSDTFPTDIFLKGVQHMISP